jgi:hypothetical protein
MNEPYYESPTQRLYRFPNGHGASVVETRNRAFDLAVIKHTGEMMTGRRDGTLTITHHLVPRNRT